MILMMLVDTLPSLLNCIPGDWLPNVQRQYGQVSLNRLPVYPCRYRDAQRHECPLIKRVPTHTPTVEEHDACLRNLSVHGSTLRSPLHSLPPDPLLYRSIELE